MLVRKARLFSVLLAACGVAMALRAPADDAQTVTLRDGTSLTGEVVEFVENDHVTLKLASGETRRIAWSDLAIPAHAPKIETADPPPTPLPLAPEAPPRPRSTQILPEDLRPEYLASAGPTGRLSFGAQVGIDSPLGDLALLVDYFPITVLGIEAAVSMPIEDEPVTFGEMLLLDIPLASILSMGGGVGFAQSMTKTIIPGDTPGVSHYLNLDCTHLGFSFTPNVTLRGTLGYTIGLNNGDYCKAHPEACPQLSSVALSGTFALFWNFNFGGGGN
jgi:hypothetical protein